MLLVDDEEDHIIIFATALERDGFEVDKFTNPNDALSKFRPGIYDLAIIDYLMPGLTGMKLYERMKDFDSSLKAIILTGYEIAEPRETNDVKIIKKPIMPSNLVGVVRSLSEG